MAVAQMERPERGLAWAREQSTPLSLAALALGGVGLLLVVLGVPAVITANGWTPVDTVVAGIRSSAVRGICAVAAVLGAAGVVTGAASFKRMGTKVAREQCIAGAVLGVQAALLGLGLMLFSTSGDVDKFALNYIDWEGVWPLLDKFVNGAKNTLMLAFTGQGIGMIGGLTLSMLAISKRAVVRAPARAYINFFRGTPLLWQLMLIGFAIPIGFGIPIPPYTAAVIAFSLNTAAYSAEVFRAGLQSIERGQLEAARGLGMSYLQAMRYAVIPQAVRRVVPPLLNEFVVLIKDTSLVLFLGLTAGQRDLMTVGNFYNANTTNATFLVATALGYLAITLPLIRIVNIVERRFRSGLVGIGA